MQVPPILIGALIVLSALAALGGIFLKRSQTIVSPAIIPSESDPTSAKLTTSDSDNEEIWQTYSTFIPFSFQYPSNLSVEDFGDGVDIHSYGYQQQRNSNLQGGINVRIRTSVYELYDTNLRTLAEQERDMAEEQGSLKEDLRPISVGKFEGYTFIVQDPQLATWFVLGLGSEGRVLIITDKTQDLTNQGYSETVNRIIQSIQEH